MHDARARPWYEDDDAVGAVVRDGILRGTTPPPRIPGCDGLVEIGRGGQGVVYEAVQTATRRRVAVKTLLDAPGRTRATRLRFLREIEVVAGLRDPRLVQVFDGGVTDDGRPFLVMELVEGVRLDECPAAVAARTDGFARPSADPAIALFAEVCEAIDHAHRHGAAAGDLAATASGWVLGSLPWTSPEQADGRASDVDVRSDVYALGATLYHVVTGGPPVPMGSELRRILGAIVSEPPVAPSALDGRCDRDVEAIILRALEKDPERRYPTAGELARDLRRLLAGEPIEARRETAWRSLVKLARRRRRIAVLAALLAAAAVAVLAVTWRLWRRAVDASELAVAESRRAEASLDFFLDALGAVDPAREGANAAEALAIYDDLVPAAREHLAQGHWLLGWFIGGRGRCLSEIGRHDEAENALAEAVSMVAAQLGADDARTLELRKARERSTRLRTEAATRPAR